MHPLRASEIKAATGTEISTNNECHSSNSFYALEDNVVAEEKI